MCLKVDLIIEALNSNPDSVFIFSDVDVQFFAKTETELRAAIRNKDIAIQRDALDGEPNTGFFIARTSPPLLKMWEDIRTRIGKEKISEQKILKKILVSRGIDFLERKMPLIQKTSRLRFYLTNWLFPCLANEYGLRWSFLSTRFFTPGMYSNRIWTSSFDFRVPSSIIMHHANWTIGVENKIAQLKYVRELLNRRV
jgi:hypothetical protein